MNAEDIRTQITKMRDSNLKLAAEMQKGDTDSAIVAVLGAIVITGSFIGEIALQLAELNEKLNPKAIFDGISAVQDMTDTRDELLDRRNR